MTDNSINSPDAVTDGGVLKSIPLAEISARPGFNPRKSFRQQPLEQLADSIRASGLIQPITVRPRTDDEPGFWITTGERRFRALTMLGRESTKAIVHYGLSEEAAKLIAVKENLDRADLSPSEEAMSAREVMDLCRGDRAAAASELGWSMSKLNARLLLLHASDAVLMAVADGSILVGHAELLAGLPHETQDKALARIIQHDVSVQDLREQVKGVVIPLAQAAFDTAGCNGCPFNTATQGTLFGDAVAGSNCKNRSCFSDKTHAALEAKRAQLAEDVGTVALSTEKDPGSYTALSPADVGQEQFQACRGCQHFGALIHSTLDSRAGRVEKPTCFNMPCHASMVATNKAAQADAAAEDAPKAGESATKPTKTAKATAGKGKPSPKASPKAGGKAKKPAAPAAISNAVLRTILPAYRAAALSTVAADPAVPLSLALVAIHKILAGAGITAPDCNVIAGDTPDAQLSAVLKADSADVLTSFRAAVEALVNGAQASSVYSNNGFYTPLLAVALAQGRSVDLTSHFTLTEEFLSAHTREGIVAILEESGFKAWLASQPDGEKSYRALVGMKKADMPPAVMKHGFDWRGFIPKSLLSVKPSMFKGLG